MLRRLASIGLGGGRLLRAEGQGLLERARRGAGWTGLLAAGGIVALVGLAAIGTAATAALAAVLGWIVAVAVAGAVVLVLGLAWVAIAWWRLERSVERSAVPAPVRADAAAARQQLRGREAPDTASGGPRPRESGTVHAEEGGPGWGDRAVRAAARHPDVVASGAFCLVALLGPGRSIRLASHAVRAGRIVSTVRNGLDGVSRPSSNGESPAVGLGHRMTAADGSRRSDPDPAAS